MTRVTREFTRPRNYYLAAAALILIGLLIGLGLSAGFDLQRVSTAARNGLQLSTNAADLPESPFVSVVERALPAVVFVDVKKKVAAADGDDPHSDLFRRFFGDNPQRRMVRPTSGSGFIIDPSGYVLTNNHVVSNADDINVTLNDGRSFKATVIGTDPETDVAVIKIEGRNLPVIPLGDSDKLRVGDYAIAIGNPLGELKGSVTMGIISAQGRSNLNIWGGTPGFQDFIQTDASINFGNSGGPLCNIRGEAIGINTAINPGGQGIGFAIPINLAGHVAEQLVATGTVKRAMLGVYLAPLTPELAEGFGIAATQEGVLIQSVNPGSAAEKAGIKRNDVIVEFDGVPVGDLQKFRLKVADTPVGKRVPLAVLREGKRVTLNVTLAERSTEALAQARPQPQPTERPTLAGLQVRDLTGSEKSELSVKTGVVITDVEDGSAANDAGLRAGDVIEEVGGKSVASVGDFTKLVRDARTRGNFAVLLRNRNGDVAFVPLRVRE